MAIALALRPPRVAEKPALAIGAAITGSLAGLAQAIGLWRWVFVIPGLARTHADPASAPAAKLAAERAFEILNQYGGVAIGEHLGQLLTALFVLMLALLQWGVNARASPPASVSPRRWRSCSARAKASPSRSVSRAKLFSFATIAGFLGLTIWLIATGIGLIRGK
ncbi:MAG: DUF4386 family protein [Alphaproteobacteria bacterium]